MAVQAPEDIAHEPDTSLFAACVLIWALFVPNPTLLVRKPLLKDCWAVNVCTWPISATVSVTSSSVSVAAEVPVPALKVTTPLPEFPRLSVPGVPPPPSVGVAVNAPVAPFGTWPAAPETEIAPALLSAKGADAETAATPLAAGRVIVKPLVAEAGLSEIVPPAPPVLARVRVPFVLPPTPSVGVGVQAGVAPPSS